MCDRGPPTHTASAALTALGAFWIAYPGLAGSPWAINISPLRDPYRPRKRGSAPRWHYPRKSAFIRGWFQPFIRVDSRFLFAFIRGPYPRSPFAVPIRG